MSWGKFFSGLVMVLAIITVVIALSTLRSDPNNQEVSPEIVKDCSEFD